MIYQRYTSCGPLLSMLFICCLPFAGLHSTDSVSAAQHPPPGSSPRLSQPPPAAVEPERDQQPRRKPPPSAIEACNGKKEGDNCVVTTPHGDQEGLCLAGRENIFACRPHRGKPSAGSSATSGQSRQPAAEREEDSARPSPESGIEMPAAKTTPALPARTEREAVPRPVVQREKPDGPAEQNPPLQQKQAPEPPATEAVPSAPALPVIKEDRQGLNKIGIAACLASALLGALLAWYGFFRFTTLPLRRLRKVTQQLAGGDLSARVGEGLVHRKDEVADLGRDVDRMAERTESLVGAHQRLIRDVSHELRSPLARLNVALELARQSAGSQNPAPFDRIERESDRLNELIGQLLMLTKLENDSGAIQRTCLDMAALITEVAQDVDFEARSTDRRVVTATQEALLLNGNKELLRQALENLVRNAVRYTAPGTAVEISLRKKETGGRSWAHIEVRDQGPGVPESELYNIFRPFYRVNDARERQSGGTGVGLAISDRAVRLHGGSLRAFNAPGVGLTMEMELPLSGTKDS